MTRLALAALTVAALTAVYLWAINVTHADMTGRPARSWDEYGDVDSEPITPARAWCNDGGCDWETTNPSSRGRMNEYLNHRDADHE